jgi:L-rhamnose mutarotase
MKRFAFTIRLADHAAVERYRAYHRDVWREIAGPGGALETIGVRVMRIYLATPLSLFMYVEGVDGFEPVRDFGRALDLHPRVREWDEIMHGQLLVRLAENRGPLEWTVMDEIYSFDAAALSAARG